ILARLRENKTALRARGVSHAALFGSRARGDNRPDIDIDIDIMIGFDPATRVTVFNYAGPKDYIAGLFDGPVDVMLSSAATAALRDIAHHIDLAVQFATGFDDEAFVADPRTVNA